MKWLDGWRSESKLVDNDGFEIGHVQETSSGWKAFVGISPIVSGNATQVFVFYRTRQGAKDAITRYLKTTETTVEA